MCDVCARKKTFVQALKPFLGEGVEVIFVEDPDWGGQDLILKRGDESLEISADGDESPTYFHWK